MNRSVKIQKKSRQMFAKCDVIIQKNPSNNAGIGS